MQQEETQKGSWWENPVKYFLHGFLFSILFLVFAFAWAFILAALILIGLFIGLVIGVIVLFFIIGSLNSFLADFIWSIRMKTNWKDLLGHGFVLFIALIIAGVPALIISLIVPTLATTIALFILYAFIDGFAAKKVAHYWSKEYVPKEKRAYEAHLKMKNPSV